MSDLDVKGPGFVWYGGHVNEELRKAGVGSGWHSLLDELHTALIAVCPEYSAIQVKEKFGLLRVYITGNEAAFTVVNEFEARSAKICEQCGQPAEVRHSTYWIHVMCDSCEHEYLTVRGKRPEE